MTIARLEIWRTETLWNATRRGPVPRPPSGFLSHRGDLCATLLEDGPRELLTALRCQAELEKEITAFLALGHTGEHDILPSCPIACLRLAQGTEDVLVVHWRGDGRYAPTISDLLQLPAHRPLDTVPGISRGRAEEITRKLKALEPVLP